MNSLTLGHVAQLISILGSGVKGPHHLIFDGSSLSLVARMKSPPGKSLLATLSQSEIRDGLTAGRWCFIESALKKINAEKNA